MATQNKKRTTINTVVLAALVLPFLYLSLFILLPEIITPSPEGISLHSPETWLYILGWLSYFFVMPIIAAAVFHKYKR